LKPNPVSNSGFSPSLNRQNGGRKKTKKERPKSPITVAPPQSRRPGLSPVSISSRIPIELSPPLDPVSLRSLNIGRIENNSNASYSLHSDSSNFSNIPYNPDNLLNGLDNLPGGLLVKKKRKTDDKISLDEQRPRKKVKRKRGPYAKKIKKIQEDLRVRYEWKKMSPLEREKLSDPDKEKYKKVRKRVSNRAYRQRRKDGIQTPRGQGVAPAKIQEDLRLKEEWNKMLPPEREKLSDLDMEKYRKACWRIANRAYKQRQRDGIRTPRRPRRQGVAPAKIQEDLRLWDEWKKMLRSVREKLSDPDKEKYRKACGRVNKRASLQRQASKLGKRKRELAASDKSIQEQPPKKKRKTAFIQTRPVPTQIEPDRPYHFYHEQDAANFDWEEGEQFTARGFHFRVLKNHSKDVPFFVTGDIIGILQGG